ncbi:MAG: hypothetical protein ACKVT1_00710 [Dehalococcoidia bacterium]
MAMTRVAIEAASKKAFGWALDWPGWCRGAKDEAMVLAALERFAPRYAVVARLAGQEFDAAGPLEVVERVAGTSSTEWGVPAVITNMDRAAITAEEAARLSDILDAVWRRFDAVADAAPAELRKGPRGGGRDTARVIEHVVSCDHGYARNIGLKLVEPAATDHPAVVAMREQMLGVLRQPSDGSPIGRKWTARYALRYIAWHALDHAWEIEDRSEAP